MKSIINEKNQIDEIKYPFLGQNIDNGDVILFYNNKCGTIVYSKRIENIGVYSTHFDMEGFKPFNGTITLEND